MKRLPAILTGVLLLLASVSAWSQKTTRGAGAIRTSAGDTTVSRVFVAPPVTPPAAAKSGSELPPAAFPTNTSQGLVLPDSETTHTESEQPSAASAEEVPDRRTGYEPGESRRRFRHEEQTREPRPERDPRQRPVREPRKPRERKPAAPADVLFGLSTNVLADLGTAVNVGVEVPMWDRWDLRAGIYSPWWKNSAKSFCFQVFHADAGVRYYLQPWERRDDGVLRGWFLSAHAGGGYYDIAPWDDGYQGWEIAAGIGGGYSLAIGSWWRIDAALAVGPFYTDYITYQDTGNRATLLQTGEGGHFRFLPTEARFSLTYLFHRKKK